MLKKFEVEIERRGKKRIRYNPDNPEVDQKREVYTFFIRILGEKSLNLERHFDV